MTIHEHKSRFKNPNPNPSLPEEFIIEILQWLPVFSLSRFKSVCKLWLSLISSPHFIKAHLSKSIQDANFTHHKFIICSGTRYFNIGQCYVSDLLNESSYDHDLDHPPEHPNRVSRIAGSCNGLVCFVVEKGSFDFWNLATRKSRRVCCPDLRNDVDRVYGFGYDKGNNDYKVIVITCGYSNVGALEAQVEIFSSKSHRWKRIGDFPFGKPRRDHGMFVNGALHWFATWDYHPLDSRIIASFDIQSETYAEVVQPEFGDGICNWSLGNLRNCLSILCSDRGTRFDVRVMKEYGVKESWTKLVVIPFMDNPLECHYTTPCIFANGNILLKFGSHTVLYKPDITQYSSCYEVATYVESLVSPNVLTGV